MIAIKKLNFYPFPGLFSGHLQTILGVYRIIGHSSPPSKKWVVDIGNNDFLACELSIPPQWQKNGRTLVMVHGLGGSHSSTYMVRLSRKFYERGDKVVRVNLRGCGSGKGLSKLPYHAGNSEDILKIVEALKQENPESEITLIGFSLGGNIILKLAGELGLEANKLVSNFIAVCAPIDLIKSMEMIENRRFYHHYFLKFVCQHGLPWIPKNKKFRTLYEFDQAITAPLWGFQGATEYYTNCSSIKFLPKIEQTTHLIFAEDDPFIAIESLKGLSLSKHVHLWSTQYGGHLGFLGKTVRGHKHYWMDQLLLNWTQGDFVSNLRV